MSARTLPTRQAQVLLGLALGLCSKQIADALGISEKTADYHRSKLMQSTNQRTVATLVRWAIRQQLIQA